jgi:hypothetical protein
MKKYYQKLTKKTQRAGHAEVNALDFRGAKLVEDFKIKEGKDKFDQFETFVKEYVENIAEKLKPSEDWEQTFYVVNDEGAFRGFIDFNVDKDKEIFCKLLMPSLIHRTKAFIYCFVSTGWQIPKNLSKSGIRPSQHPDRVEILFIEVISFDKIRFLTGNIIRQEGKHPQIESWKVSDNSSQGRFVDPVKKALLKNNKKCELNNGKKK